MLKGAEILRCVVALACFHIFFGGLNCADELAGGSSNLLNKTTACHPYCIVPDRCESPIRGHFDKIYETGFWNVPLRQPSDFYSNARWPPGEKRRTSSSGKGSDLGSPTETSLRIINDAIERFDVKSMVDVPCGDANWIFDSFQTDALPFYAGLDITGAVIRLNNQRFAHHMNKQFHFWDATQCELPKFRDEAGNEHAFDLVHVRDVIQHMALDQGLQFFCNVFNAGPKVLVTTTYDKVGANQNIKEGGWYQNNLWLEPFSFPKIECTPTHPEHEPDLTCVYNLTEEWAQQFVSSKCA